LALEKGLNEPVEDISSAITEIASETLGSPTTKKKPRISNEILDLCDERRKLKHSSFDPEGARQCREVNKNVRNAIKKDKENWIQGKCQEIENNLRSTIVKKAYQLVKELTGKKQDKVNIIEDKNGEIITQDENIHGRWSEYCEDLYNHEYHGDQIVLESPEPTKWENQLILKHEIEAVIKSLKKENRLELIIF